MDDEARMVGYRVDDGPGAASKENVQGYFGEVRVFPVTDADQTFVLWTSRRAPGGSPGAGTTGTCDPVGSAGARLAQA